MSGEFDVTAWREAFTEAFATLGTRLATEATAVAMGALLVVVGWLLAHVVALVLARGLSLIGLDPVVARLAPAGMLAHAGIRQPPSQVFARLVFWLVFLSFALLSVETANIPMLTAAVENVLSYLPSLVRATLVVLVGLLVARFLRAVATSVATASGMPAADRMGRLVQALMVGLVLVFAIEQLGLPVSIVVVPLTTLIGVLGFAGGLAFALGARPIITHILAGHFLRESLPRNAFVEINGERGVVERVGSTDTVLRSDERRWSIPNARLIDEIVVR